MRGALVKRLGSVLMLGGVLLALFGVAQLAWVGWTSTDPRPNPVGSGMLLAACWYGGITLFGVGDWIAGRFRWPLV
jgi:hypothetical protein